jgi:tripartite-type tricarboxylate transporter receptor subunit TctC
LLAACAPAAPSPTAAPPPKPTEAPKPAATTAPAKPTEAPAAKPAEAKPAASPAAKAEPKPAEAKPAPSTGSGQALSKAEGPAPSPAVAAKPAASPAAKVDEKALADFYRGKTMKIVVGTGPGGTFDAYSRLLARYMPKYLPGSPNIIVENRPGAGGLTAANAVYNVEPQDGTILLSVNEYIAFLQAVGAPGVQLDAAKMNWLGASVKTAFICTGRIDSGVSSVQELMSGSKELLIGTISPANSTHDVPAVLNATLGTKMKLVPGYESFNVIKLAIERKEVEGVCGGWDGFVLVMNDLIQPDKPVLKTLVSLGPLTPQAQEFPFLKDVPVAESVATTDEAKQLLRVMNTPAQMSKPFAVGPGVPMERVAALRDAVAKSYADAEFLAEAKRSNLFATFSSGTEVQGLVQQMLATPKPVLDKLKDVLK